MKVIITMNLDDEFADPEHPTGVTEAGYDQITDLLGTMGDDIDVAKAPDD
jgi:hypothetical protein